MAAGRETDSLSTHGHNVISNPIKFCAERREKKRRRQGHSSKSPKLMNKASSRHSRPNFHPQNKNSFTRNGEENSQMSDEIQVSSLDGFQNSFYGHERREARSKIPMLMNSLQIVQNIKFCLNDFQFWSVLKMAKISVKISNCPECWSL